MRSTRLSAGSCSEGTTAVPLYPGSQAQLLDRLRQQIHRVADQFGQAPFQCAEREQPDASVRIELDNKIDVAAGSASPRAMEPNSDRWRMPARRSSTSRSRKVVITCPARSVLVVVLMATLLLRGEE